MLKSYNDKNELEILKNLYGTPLLNKFLLRVDEAFPPPWSEERKGEVVMVLQREDQKIWVMRKKSYPTGVYRLPSGGINPNEDIQTALKRELKEETSLEMTPKKFLEAVHYEFITKSKDKAFFSSYIFYFYPVKTSDIVPDTKEERISHSRWVKADNLEALGILIKERSGYKKSLGYGAREDWCKFRSIIHHEVYKLLT